MIPIGGTCVGFFGSDPVTETDEIRKLTTARHEPIYTDVLNKNLSLKKRLIVNVDSYNDGDRGWKSDDILRNLTELAINEVNAVARRYGVNARDYVTFTFDNEADEIYDRRTYCHYANIFIDQIGNRFDVGLGNFNGLQLDYYDYVCSQMSGFKYLDIHLQRDFETAARVDVNLPKLKTLADRYNKKLRVTEAFPVTADLWTDSGYNLLHYQLVKAKEYGAGAFCCFIRFDRDGSYGKLAFLRGSRVHPRWEDFKKIIRDNAPEPKERIIDGMIIRTIGHHANDVKYGYGVELLHELLINKGYISGEDDIENMRQYDDFTRDAVERFQSDLYITVDGRVGRQTWRKFINSIADAETRKKFQFDFEVVMSPYNLNGDT